MKNKLKIGQIVYGEPLGNAARYNKEIKEFTVASLGNKYFTLNNEKGYSHRIKFSYETMNEVCQYSSDWHIWLSKKDIENKRNKPILINQINVKLGSMSHDELNELLNHLTK